MHCVGCWKRKFKAVQTRRGRVGAWILGGRTVLQQHAAKETTCFPFPPASPFFLYLQNLGAMPSPCQTRQGLPVFGGKIKKADTGCNNFLPRGKSKDSPQEASCSTGVRFGHTHSIGNVGGLTLSRRLCSPPRTCSQHWCPPQLKAP